MYKVLIVDDTQANIDILKDTLSSEYQVSVAKDGLKAIKIIEKNRPDIILLDIVMPIMGGYEVIKLLKEDDRHKDIPVIFITAQTELNEKTYGFELGAVDYISKPFEVLEVKARVATHIELIKSKKEIEELLSKTLIGTIGIFMELLKNTHSDVFALSHKIKIRSASIAKKLDVKDLWMVEIGGLLSQLGMLYMNPKAIENLISGRFVGSLDMKQYKQGPKLASDLVKKIPRLESVGKIIELLSMNLGETTFNNENTVYSGAQIIQAVINYELGIEKGLDSGFIVKKMLANKKFSKVVVEEMNKSVK